MHNVKLTLRASNGCWHGLASIGALLHARIYASGWDRLALLASARNAMCTINVAPRSEVVPDLLLKLGRAFIQLDQIYAVTRRVPFTALIVHSSGYDVTLATNCASNAVTQY